MRTVVHQWSRRDVRDAPQGLSVVETTLETSRASVRDLKVGGVDEHTHAQVVVVKKVIQGRESVAESG